MKKLFLSLLAISVQSICSFAQNNVKLVIHHKLGEDDFAMNSGSKNNLGDDFEVTRLEYYISGISVIHDNGIATPVPDLWILVNAASLTEVEFGSFPINEVEAIHFTIGVDPDHNHLDPASYDPSHPLAPQSPSMHWGWASGYRFLAFEGNGSPQYNQLIQLHGLGDQNYIKTRVNLFASTINNEVVIKLDADYNRALEDINVNQGIIVHAETGEAQQALENFRNLVFSPSEANTGTSGWNQVNRFDLNPNPTSNGYSVAFINSAEDADYTINITDILGRQITYLKAVKPNTNTYLSIQQPGIYIVSLLKNGIRVSTEKLMSD